MNETKYNMLKYALVVVASLATHAIVTARIAEVTPKTDNKIASLMIGLVALGFAGYVTGVVEKELANGLDRNLKPILVTSV